jgi:prevent-host-death family protein
VRSVSIAELKNRLSAYLDLVRQGEEVLVRDRKRPVAKIVPLSADDWQAEEEALIAAGLMRPPDEDPTPAFWTSFWRMPAPRVSARRVATALRWARGDR